MTTNNKLYCSRCGVSLANATAIQYLNGSQPVCDLCLIDNQPIYDASMDAIAELKIKLEELRSENAKLKAGRNIKGEERRSTMKETEELKKRLAEALPPNQWETYEELYKGYESAFWTAYDVAQKAIKMLEKAPVERGK